ncbi:MAG TPA: Rieske (2Fe-2S) protein [Bacteroidales bacterium]|nr:Rieske (2Fe-2S) protein [Bacteroidales bacterium]HRZ76908.1 Rieske (2Fe-2S) protein [Bacteroidales bacterium]
MHPHDRQGRRRFIRYSGWLMAAPFAWLAWRMERRDRGLQPPSRVLLPSPAADGVHFHGEVILVRQGGELRAFAARCMHLGCLIDQVRGEELQCPCHGSRYDLQGQVLQGPASGPLRQLELSGPDPDGRIEVSL